MFNEFDHVRVKEVGVTGTIIDVYTAKDGITYYTVENDKEAPIDAPNAWNSVRFPQIDCIADQLELICD